jgi:hypothetical protein
VSVSGSYMQSRVRNSVAPGISDYCDWVLGDLVPSFADLERRAQEIADTEYSRLGSMPAGPDCDGDMSDAAESANERGQQFYEKMAALQQSVINLFSVGLFHLLEQQLADLCSDASFEVRPPKGTELESVRRWFQKHLGISLKDLPCWSSIKELQLVANVVKHAAGWSSDELKNLRPDLFYHRAVLDFCSPGSEMHDRRPVRIPLSGEDLYVSEQDFRKYAAAASEVLDKIARHFELHSDDYFPR